MTASRGSDPVRVGDYLEQFTLRLLQHALDEATAAYWRRRAEQFEAVGTPSADATALACRRHAGLLDETRGQGTDVADHFGEAVA